MSKRQIIMILGALIIIIAILSGLPSSWNTVLYIILAFFIIAAAYLMKPAPIAKPDPAMPFVEHAPISDDATRS